jgi:hypothetical protein
MLGHVGSFTPAENRRDLHEGTEIKAKGGVFVPVLGDVQRTVSYLKHAPRNVTYEKRRAMSSCS